MKSNNIESNLGDKILDLLNFILNIYIGYLVWTYTNNILYGILAIVGIFLMGICMILTCIKNPMDVIANPNVLSQIVVDNIWKITILNLIVIVLLRLSQ